MGTHSYYITYDQLKEDLHKENIGDRGLAPQLFYYDLRPLQLFLMLINVEKKQKRFLTPYSQRKDPFWKVILDF